ncbi:hypothetical protein ACFL27_12940 [candidate division CSSED10-310 bacterium]|uniref:Metallo-beta-lactamase domain-containing protein n=1 Tax=candidate division CSSED10-310 bacterium TaxID=2855610 RepID=A0ABV6YY08_UNCC1
MEKWSDGIYLLGQYNFFQTGCWLLTHGKQGIIVELPPYSRQENSPAIDAYRATQLLDISIRYICCTHFHCDHFSWKTAREFHMIYPKAQFLLQERFSPPCPQTIPFRYFKRLKKITLSGEPLHLLYAPKHSWTDTMIIFRGAMITGDWELNTIRSVHDRKGRYSIPRRRKRASIRSMINFSLKKNYHIHKIFSVHANDRRHNVNFPALMQDTLINRRIW